MARQKKIACDLKYDDHHIKISMEMKSPFYTEVNNSAFVAIDSCSIAANL